MILFYKLKRAAIIIQKWVRMYLAKQQKLLLKHTKFGKVIQKYARRYLAVLTKKKLKCNKAATKIQVIF